MESPFFLLYGHDPRLPMETALTPPNPRAEVDVDTYKEKIVQGLTEAWGLAHAHVCRAQDRQKKVHALSFHVGKRVFLYELAAKSSKAHKFACPVEIVNQECITVGASSTPPVDSTITRTKGS